MHEKRLRSWREWYGFARERLGYEQREATEYANLRYAEELNRADTGGRIQPSSRSRDEPAPNSGVSGADGNGIRTARDRMKGAA